MATSRLLFAARLQQEGVASVSASARGALTARAVELYERCYTSLPQSELETPLEGGWRTAANMCARSHAAWPDLTARDLKPAIVFWAGYSLIWR